MEPIVLAIQRYIPNWIPPADNGRDWVHVLCPFHAESRPSAAVSFKYNAFKCLSCPAAGSVITLIKQQEGVSYREAKRLAETVYARSDDQVSPSTGWESGRDVPQEQRIVSRESRSREVSTGLRGRSTRWT